MMQKHFLLAALSACAVMVHINAGAAVVWPQPESFYGAANATTNQRMVEQPAPPTYYGYPAAPFMSPMAAPMNMYGQPMYYPSSTQPAYGWQNMMPNQMPSIPAMNLSTPSMSMPSWNNFPSPASMMPFGGNGFNGMPFGFGN
ncbi:MAG: hypothetical protein K0U21_05220 [Proteobacteria bacterium]|nr:hypothetical protein [Pseudomonadota bacterium]